MQSFQKKMTPKEKTKAVELIEEKMQDLDEHSIRYKTLEAAKNFKLSWVNLGHWLYSVLRDKLYREWGYLSFEAYCAKEIGIKRQTAVKLLRSYYFLEREEPHILNIQASDKDTVSRLPSYEAVNLLRLVKDNKKLDKTNYEALRENVLEKGRDARDIKKELRVMTAPEQADPGEKEKRKLSSLRRMLSVLNSLKAEMKDQNMLPGPLLVQMDRLIIQLKKRLNSINGRQ